MAAVHGSRAPPQLYCVDCFLYQGSKNNRLWALDAYYLVSNGWIFLEILYWTLVQRSTGLMSNTIRGLEKYFNFWTWSGHIPSFKLTLKPSSKFKCMLFASFIFFWMLLTALHCHIQAWHCHYIFLIFYYFQCMVTFLKIMGQLLQMKMMKGKH